MRSESLGVLQWRTDDVRKSVGAHVRKVIGTQVCKYRDIVCVPRKLNNVPQITVTHSLPKPGLILTLRLVQGNGFSNGLMCMWGGWWH